MLSSSRTQDNAAARMTGPVGLALFPSTKQPKIVLSAALALVVSLITTLPFAPAFAKQSVHTDVRPPVHEELIRGKQFVVASITVKARPEQVWTILADYNNASSHFSVLRKCELVCDKGDKKIVKHELAPSGIPDTFEYILEIQETPPTTMEWHRLSGDFKEVDGFWKLESIDSGRSTLVTYASHVNGGFFIPQILINHQVGVDMPGVLLSLKHHAEASSQIASRHGMTAPTE